MSPHQPPPCSPPEARVGDYVLVHAGVALTVVDEEEAKRVFEALRKLDQLEKLTIDKVRESAT